MISLKGLKIKIPGLVVSAEDVEVNPGEWLSLRAPSGFGKSTLFRGIIGLEKIEGEIWLRGKRVDGLPVHRRNFGVVFQEPALFPHLNAMENALFGIRLRRKPTKTDLQAVKEAFQVLSLDHRWDAMVTELSGGERQRLALIRCLAFDPDLLLLDEPFRGLDAALIQSCRGLIERFLSRRPVPVIWITHQDEFAPALQKVLLGGETTHGCRHFQYHSSQS